MTIEDETDPADDDEDATRRRKAVEQFDSGVVDLLSWVLDTETRAKIYIFLQANAPATSEEIAQGTGLYPSTVREALAELHEEGKVEREKRESKGAGNNPYEYTAIPPSELVSGVVGQVQDELNAVFNLDDLLDRDREDPPEPVDTETQEEPVTITVESDDEDVTPGDESDVSEHDSAEEDALEDRQNDD